MFTWLILHIIGNIPTWVWPFVAGAGAAAYFLSAYVGIVPVLAPYRLPIRIVTGLIFVGGVFMYGGAGVTAILQADIRAAEQRAAIAEQQSTAVNQQLSTVLASNDHLIKGRAYGINKDIESNRSAINSECKLSDAAWMLYNRSSQNKVASSSTGTTATSR